MRGLERRKPNDKMPVLAGVAAAMGITTVYATSMNRWILGGGALVGLLLIGTKAKAAFIEPDQNELDLDALASMLIAETAFARDRNEMAQIVFVAVNRARKYKTTLQRVVTPPGYPVWNGSSAYRTRFEDAPGNARWVAARTFAQQVVSGISPYRNAGATLFVHPTGMGTPPCSGSYVATTTFAGTRCLPTWAVSGKVIGGAMFA